MTEHAILDRFSRLRMLVAGDVMLDRDWWGQASRLSPEAPVPVVRIERTSLLPGGAANSAANLVSLGARAELVGVIGEDAEDAELGALAERLGIDPGGLVRTWRHWQSAWWAPPRSGARNCAHPWPRQYPRRRGPDAGE